MGFQTTVGAEPVPSKWGGGTGEFFSKIENVKSSPILITETEQKLMTRKILIYVFCLLILTSGAQLAEAKGKTDVLGLRVGMSREEATARLEKIGKKDHDERKQQEIWTLTNDKRFSHVIIAFDKEFKAVRFVTAKAREGGKRVRYSDVLDTKKAVARNAANNYKYVFEVPTQGSKTGYKIIARGTDKDYLTYFAVEELDTVQNL